MPVRENGRDTPLSKAGINELTNRILRKMIDLVKFFKKNKDPDDKIPRVS